MVEYRNFYRNRDYAFSVLIPKGLKGLTVPEPYNRRGFVILWSSSALLAVSAEQNVQDYNNALGAARGELQAYTEFGKGKVLSTELKETAMGGLPAETLQLRYTCPPANTEYLLYEGVGFRSYVYIVSFKGPLSEFAESKLLIDKLTSSFKYLLAKQ